MSTTQHTQYARIPAWLRDLHFVTDFFSWLFALCSRLAEPFMLICTIYIVAEAGVPSIAIPALHNLAIGIMITAPELILPGAFVVAARAQEHARLLFAVCWTFVALTLITLISLFVWHFTGASLAWLMCARCATAVGYSILMRVMHHERRDEPTANTDRTAIDHSNTEAVHHLVEQVQALTSSVSTVTLTVRELLTTSAPVALPMPVTTCEYVPFVANEQGDHRVIGANSQSGFSFMEYGALVDTSTDEGEEEHPSELRLIAPVHTANTESEQSEQSANTGDRIRTALAHQPDLSDRELAALVGCSASTANKWRRRIEQVA